MEWASNHAKNFPNELKLADITPILKRDDSTLTKNYRPVSVLPYFKKFWENNANEDISIHREIFVIYHHFYVVIGKALVLNCPARTCKEMESITR